MENVEIVRRGYEAYNRGDLAALGELLAPDAAIYPLPYGVEGPRYGREEIVRLVADIREPLEQNEAAAEKLVAGGNHVVTAHHWRGVLKGTQDEVESRIGMMVTIRAGKVTEIRTFGSFAEALEAAGLSQ